MVVASVLPKLESVADMLVLVVAGTFPIRTL